jgi:pimeloyl-ACP methyl ester carboxylesterase
MWQKLTPFLRAAGHEVYTPTLTGLGERVHLASQDITLDTHITDVVNVLEYEDLREVNLVGWSYGGIVMTGVAHQAPERIAQLIYLDAGIPEDGQSDYDLEPGGEVLLADDLAQAAAAGSPGFKPVPEAGIRALITDEALQAWMLRSLVPHPIAAWAQPISLDNPAADTIPRAYILCTEGRDPDSSDPGFLGRVRTDPAWRYRELKANHGAPVSMPGETAEMLLDLVS